MHTNFGSNGNQVIRYERRIRKDHTHKDVCLVLDFFSSWLKFELKHHLVSFNSVLEFLF